MGCATCSSDGCGNKGSCGTGGCNKMNTYDWINTMDISDPTEFQFVEVSFKNGSHKDFFINDEPGQYVTGDMVIVEAQTGYDVGQISLMGELVRMQMKKKYVTEDRVHCRLIRRAHTRDIEKLQEARSLEPAAMVRARAISASLGLDMKVGDVEFQGDLRKATFYYTANGRVDFRELVRIFAKEFRVKIEMRQIGSRQESARIGGLGSCGRELCCSTWLSDFRSVNTSAARYQNISINQTKLSGQCGRLKCCLNYELDSYLDALKSFPDRADTLKTQKGRANLMKTDIFKGIMYYAYDEISMRGVFHPIPKDKVKEILSMNSKGVFPEDLTLFYNAAAHVVESEDEKFADVTGEIELPAEIRKKKKNKRKPGQPDQRSQGQPAPENNQNTRQERGPRNDQRNEPRNDQRNRPGQPQSNNRPEKKISVIKSGDHPAPDDKPANLKEDKPQANQNNQRDKPQGNRNNQKKRPNRPNRGNRKSDNSDPTSNKL